MTGILYHLRDAVDGGKTLFLGGRRLSRGAVHFEVSMPESRPDYDVNASGEPFPLNGARVSRQRRIHARN